jgi:hypothetical protein
MEYCSVEGCTNTVYAKGLCHLDYQRQPSILEYRKKYNNRPGQKEKARAYNDQWRKENKEYYKEYLSAYTKNRYANDPAWRKKKLEDSKARREKLKRNK